MIAIAIDIWYGYPYFRSHSRRIVGAIAVGMTAAHPQSTIELNKGVLIRVIVDRVVGEAKILHVTHHEIAMLIRVCHRWMLISQENVWSLHSWDLNISDYVFNNVVRIPYMIVKRIA